MAVTVKSITLWRREVENTPGALSRILEPLSQSGADLGVLMGYRYPGSTSKAAIELYPISGKKALAAAKAAGLSSASLPALLVEGDNKPGTAFRVARAIADAGINIDFLVAQAVGRKYSAVFGFETEAEAKRAATVIKKASIKPK